MASAKQTSLSRLRKDLATQKILKKKRKHILLSLSTSSHNQESKTKLTTMASAKQTSRLRKNLETKAARQSTVPCRRSPRKRILKKESFVGMESGTSKGYIVGKFGGIYSSRKNAPKSAI